MGSPPSNGTMGHMWMDRWCFRCVNDHGFSHVSVDEQQAENGCKLLLRTMSEPSGTDFPELRDLNDYQAQRGWDPAKLECVLFERCPCEDDPGWEPTPAPIPDPNQGLLFDVVDDSLAVPGGAVIMGALFDDGDDRIVGALGGRLIVEGPAL